MWKKKSIALFLLFFFLSQLYCQDRFATPLDQMLASIEELERLEYEKLNELQSLRNMNGERANDLIEREKRIEEKEKDLSELRLQLSLLKASVEERSQKQQSLERSIVFWRTSTIVLGTTTLTGIIVIAIIASKY